MPDVLARENLKRQIRDASIPSFDTSQLVDFHEELQLPKAVAVKKVKPLVLNPGSLMVTEKRVYFQPAPLNNTGGSGDGTTQSLDLRRIRSVYRRRYLLRQIGIEIIMDDGASSFYIFDNKIVREEVFAVLIRQEELAQGHQSLEYITRQWQLRKITNFEYLMHLNKEADRSINDLTQYPVFPHIIADYSSLSLDLDNPATFRDLSKPLGALNPIRLQFFRERFLSMPPADLKNGTPPPFLYGTHYSTPGYVLYLLVRVAPEYMLCLQAGKFDAPDRMFHSLSETWESCLQNPADLKELIPEFYSSNGEFLVNNDSLDLGHRQTGERLGDVELPPWARNSRDFIRKNAKALESE
jgi:factor associated with neutral sphingomyelinase activation